MAPAGWDASGPTMAASGISQMGPLTFMLNYPDHCVLYRFIPAISTALTWRWPGLFAAMPSRAWTTTGKIDLAVASHHAGGRVHHHLHSAGELAFL